MAEAPRITAEELKKRMDAGEDFTVICHVRARCQDSMAHASAWPTLLITAGCGWIQREGGPIEEIRRVMWSGSPPGEKHWHGATETTGMTHIAILEQLDGKSGDWMEKVTDQQYRR